MTKEQKIKIVLLLNIIIVFAEVGAGVYANSMALLSDAFHNLGDVLAVAIAFVALIYSRRSASEMMTFGFIRSEMMAAFVNALFLTVTMIFILFESIQKFFHPESINAPVVIGAAFIALIANAFSALLLKESGMGHSHTHDHNHKEEDHQHHDHYHDANMAAAYWHMAGDAAISLGVVLGGIAIWLWNIVWIDPALSVLFSLIILKEAYTLLRQSFLSLMDANKDGVETITTAVSTFSSVHSIHDLHLTRPNSKEFYCSMHVVLYDNPGLEEVETLLEEIRSELNHLGVTHAIIQPETLKYATHETLCNGHH